MLKNMRLIKTLNLQDASDNFEFGYTITEFPNRRSFRVVDENVYLYFEDIDKMVLVSDIENFVMTAKCIKQEYEGRCAD